MRALKLLLSIALGVLVLFTLFGVMNVVGIQLDLNP